MKDNSQSSMCCGPHAAGNREAGVCLFGVSRSTSDWDRSQFTDDSKIVAMSHETLNCLTIFLELPQLTPSERPSLRTYYGVQDNCAIMPLPHNKQRLRPCVPKTSVH